MPMKKVLFAAQVFAFTVLFATIALPMLAQGLHHSSQELAAWRQRLASGPYRLAGDAGTNTPPDWTRISQYADDFRASPMDTGNRNDEDLDIWTGYRYTIDSLEQYPVWQGIKMAAAGFRFLLTGDTSYGNPVRRTLLAQVRFTHPTHQGYDVSTWPIPASSQRRPTPESGAKEAVWLCRLLFAYDYTKGLFTAAEQAEVEDYLARSARYFSTRTHTQLRFNFPNRLRNDYATRVGAAAPGGVPQWTPPIYMPQTTSSHAVWPNGQVYTHRNADGSLGNAIPRLASFYNNRVYEKMHFMGLCGLLTGDTTLVWNAKQAAKEFIMFSVFPDGTFGEYERNGNYGNPHQGTWMYGGLNLQAVIMLADALARRGDFSLYQFQTRDGAHNMVVPAGGRPKSLELVLDKVAQNAVGNPGIFYNTTAPNNRLDVGFEGTNRFGTNHCTWDYLLAVANKYYQKPLWRDTYLRRAAGAVPYPTSGFGTAAKVWIPWSGTGAEYPGFLFMFGQMESVRVYASTPCDAPTAVNASNITTTGARINYTSGAQMLRIQVRPAGGNWTSITDNAAPTTLTNLQPGTAYEVRVRALCTAIDSSNWSATVSFSTQAPPCLAATGLAVAPASSTSLTVTATAAAGATQYRVEYRAVGTTTWMSTAAASFPVTLTGLQAATGYEVRVVTVCGAATSPATTVVTAQTSADVCAQAANLAGQPFTTTDSALLTWNNAAGAQSYQLRLRATGTTNWKFVVVSETRHVEAQLAAGRTYEFQVNTICPARVSGYTASRTFAMPTAPCDEPTGMSVAAITQTSAVVSFIGTAPRYEVRHRIEGSTNWLADTVTTSPTALAGLRPATGYEVQLRALCASNASTYTGSLAFTTQTPPCDPVAGLAISNISFFSATLTWQGVAGNTAGYNVRYRQVGTTSWATSTAQTATAALASLPAYADVEAQVQQRCGGSAVSAWSAMVTFRTLALPCPAPAGLAVRLLNPTTAQATWQASSNASAYQIRVEQVGQGQPTLYSVGAPATSLSISNLVPGALYRVSLQSTCPGGQSGWAVADTIRMPAITALAALGSAGWTLSPNPAAEGTRLQGPAGTYQVLLLDVAGKQLAAATKVIAESTPADLADMLPTTPGLYWVVAHGPAGQYKGRLVRQ